MDSACSSDGNCSVDCRLTVARQRMSPRKRRREDVELPILRDPLVMRRIIVGKGAGIQRKADGLRSPRLERHLGESLEFL